MHPPSREDFEGPFRNASILCQTRGRRRPTEVTWYKNGSPVAAAAATTATTVGPEVVAESRISVTESEWDTGATFSCVVEGEMRNTSKRMECGCKWKGGVFWGGIWGEIGGFGGKKSVILVWKGSMWGKMCQKSQFWGH